MNEISQLTELHSELERSHLGYEFITVLQFIFDLQKGDFTKKGRSWVYDPNFVVLSIHSQITSNVTIDLRGNVYEFPQFSHLPLVNAQNGYSRCKVEGVFQLDAALTYIRYVHKFWKEGADRIKRERKIVEI